MKYKEDPSAGEKFITDSMGLLGIATSADDALKTADLVVEAVRTKFNISGYVRLAIKMFWKNSKLDLN